MSPNQSLVGFNTFTILLAMINAVLLFLVAKRFFFDKLKAILDDREEYINTTLNEAEEAKEEAEKSKEEYKIKISDTKKEADEIIRAAKLHAHKESEGIIHEARKESTNIKRRAMADIESEREQVKDKMVEEITNASISIAGKIIEKEIDEEKHDEFIKKFINNLDNMDDVTGVLNE